MERIAFYGKGGIGKSTIATSTSLLLARKNHRVLHVGCDPKHDSSLVLVKDPKRFKTVVDQIVQGNEDLEPEDLIMEGIEGIHCVESGGPQAGRGCGGRAVSRSFEIFEEIDLVDPDLYDTVVYDVLGDVVCGGFAAPMRRSARSKVVIILSEEMMAAYAANRIGAAITQFQKNGIVLAGLVVNLRNNQADLNPIIRFANALNTQILGVIPRDPLVCEAELYRQSIIDYAPNSPVAQQISKIAQKILNISRADCPVPTPIPDVQVREIMRGFSAENPVSSPPPKQERISLVKNWSRI